MKQIRFQPLSKTYQKLSTLLCSTALNIQTTDYTKTADWTRLIQQVKTTCTAFKAYAEKEESILFPVLHEYEPAMVAILREALIKRMQYLNDLSELFGTMQSATDKQKSKLFSHKLVYRFDEFVASTLQQLNDFERMINQVLWRYYSDKELAGVAALLIVTPVVQSGKKDLTFADNIINNIIPATATQPAHRHTRTNKTYKQHRASTGLAYAI